MIVSTDAIVLRSMKYRDTSKIVTLYSRKYGKIKVLAKGARSARSKFGASLEPMMHSGLVIYKKEHRNLHLLSKSEIASPFLRLNEDGDKLAAGLAVVELVNMAMHDEEENGPMYSLLLESLRAVDASRGNPKRIFLAFALKMAVIFGYGLSLHSCSRCGRDMPSKPKGAFGYLMLSTGSAVCADCRRRFSAGGMRVSCEVLHSLDRLNAARLSTAEEVAIPASKQDEMLDLLQHYLQYHIEGVRTLKSLSLFNKV